MLRFFFTRENLPAIKTQEATAFELQSALAFKDDIIPFSHMYITSDSYLKQIQVSLEKEKQNAIIQVSQEQTNTILSQANFPANITDYNIDSISELITLLDNKNDIHIAIINGIGGDYGDNYIGLAILQRLSKLLAPRKVTFHLMQSFNLRFAEIYQNNEELINAEVIVHNNIMDVEAFMSMNAYINLTGILNFSEFGTMSHNTFFSTAFSLENIISDNNLQPHLAYDTELSLQVRQQLESRFAENKPIVFLHLIATDVLKTCNTEFVQTLITSLISMGFHVITPNPVQFSDNSFCDCSDLATSIYKFTHLIAACDSVITTGDLSLNIAAAFGKPTTLLPVTKSNIRTATQLPEVLIWLPHKNKNLYIDKVSSIDEQDIKAAKRIWQNIDTEKLTTAIKDYQGYFQQNADRSHIQNAPKRLAVIIPYHNDTNESLELLNLCLNELTKVEGFDALWLDIIDCRNEYMFNTRGLNTGISKAIKHDCDFVWILEPRHLPKPDYFSQALKRFESDSSIAIVAGMQISKNNQTRVTWAGSRSAFPKRQYKSGKITNSKINTPTSEHWVPFQSAIIRTSAIIELGLLDESMRNQFSDTDYCFRLKKRGWSIAYEPKSQSFRVDIENSIEENLDELKVDFKYFFKKWSKLTHCQEIGQLHRSIVKHIDRYNKKRTSVY